MATHSSIFAWKIPWTEKPGRLQSIGLHSRTWLSTLAPQTFFFYHIRCVLKYIIFLEKNGNVLFSVYSYTNLFQKKKFKLI